MVLEQDEQRLVIDPGDFALSLPNLSGVVAIIITHVHFDHLNEGFIQKLLLNNPGIPIFTVGEVQQKLPNSTVVKAGEVQTAGPFSLEFFGEKHAQIHSDFPLYENIGVLVNDAFYYAGDSLVSPGKPVKVLAVPVSGPWSKVSEVLDYFGQIGPGLAIPTHDSLNSDAGNVSQDGWFTLYSKNHGLKYQRLSTGESITV